MGALLKEFGVRVRPRSVAYVHKLWLTPRMKHTRVPRTVRRDIWRLAIETSSIPSFHIFRRWIRNQIECRIKNRKKPNGPNRKSNHLTKKRNSTYLVPGRVITRADWCGTTFAQASNFLTKTTLPWKFNLPYAIPDQTSLFCANFVPTSISPTLYGLLYSVVMFLQQRTKDTGTNNPIDQDVDMISPWRCCCCCWWCCWCCWWCCCWRWFCLWWLGVAPKMKSGRPIKISFIIKYQ